MTFKVFTFSQILTVKNCKDMADCVAKLSMHGISFKDHVWNIEEVKNV